MKTIAETIEKAKESGSFSLNDIEMLKQRILPVGTQLKHKKVFGQIITGYDIMPGNVVVYLTNEGKFGMAREHNAQSDALGVEYAKFNYSDSI